MRREWPLKIEIVDRRLLVEIRNLTKMIEEALVDGGLFLGSSRPLLCLGAGVSVG